MKDVVAGGSSTWFAPLMRNPAERAAERAAETKRLEELEIEIEEMEMEIEEMEAEIDAPLPHPGEGASADEEYRYFRQFMRDGGGGGG